MLFRKHKPAWLYESLPVFYMSSGVTSMVVLEPWVANLSGLLLIATGFWVLALRYHHRSS